jgi:hypothetical protein
MHELPEHLKGRAPVNPNIPTREQAAEEDEDAPLLELLNPHLDKPSAIFGSCVMAATLVTILVLNASSPGGSEHPVFWVTVPAAVLMLSWDLSFGWIHRDDTRRLARGEGKLDETLEKEDSQSPPAELPSEKTIDAIVPDFEKSNHPVESPRSTTKAQTKSVSEVSPNDEDRPSTPHPRASLQSLITDAWSWLRQTFPTTTVVLRLLPLKLVPFALAMFILVQALVTKVTIDPTIPISTPLTPSLPFRTGLGQRLRPRLGPLGRTHGHHRRRRRHGLPLRHPLQRPSPPPPSPSPPPR